MIERGLIIPDVHVPYHDRRAFDLVLSVKEAFKFDHLITLGDFADFYCVSSHSKDPTREYMFNDEVKLAKKALLALGAGIENKVFISGNHENRLERYIEDKCPELHKFVKIKDILNLAGMSYKYVPYKSHYQLDRVFFTHDIGTAGKYAHYKALETFQGNVVHGHTHRLATAYEGNAKGGSHVGIQLGWLGDASKADYMHKIKAQRDWHLGFGIFYRDTETKLIYIQAIPIVNYSCAVEGSVFTI
jgi:predicted phosphodiesterase